VRSDRIRVAHVITRMIVGGAQETVLLAAALADRERFEPIIVCGSETGSEGSLHDEVERRGVELVVVPELVREVNPRADALVIPALARLFRQRGIDVVHTNSSKAGIVGRIAARRAHARSVVHTVHGWPFHEHQRPAMVRVWKQLERHCAPLADRLVVVADADRRKGLAAGIGRPEQYVTVRSGLELAEYDPTRAQRAEVRQELGLPLDVPVVGTVSRLSPQKDPITHIEAFATLRQQHPTARLLLVGDGPLAGEVTARVAALGLTDSVVMTGLRHDVPRLLQGMDVFLSCSLWEGLPRTIIAAMATGVPVVATPADGVRDVIRDHETGRVFPMERPEIAAWATGHLLKDPKVAAMLSGAALDLTHEFDAKTMAERLSEVYVESVGR
jgi:glycosyltransferase involved in cell wall biosynthesis